MSIYSISIMLVGLQPGYNRHKYKNIYLSVLIKMINDHLLYEYVCRSGYKKHRIIKIEISRLPFKIKNLISFCVDLSDQ